MVEQQEEKKRKKYLLPIILLFAVCLVGAGFAYTAWTENGHNQPASEYVVLTQHGEGMYCFAPDNTMVYYDTEDKGKNVTDHYESAPVYKLTEDVFINDPIPGAAVVRLGSQFEIHTAYQGFSIANLTCAVTADFVDNSSDGWDTYLVIKDQTTPHDDVIMKFVGGVWKTRSDAAWVDGNTFTIYYTSSTYDVMTVDVYYGYINASTDEQDGTEDVPPNFPLSGATKTEKTLKFTVTRSGENPGVVLDCTQLP
jgi:flagellar basal body-associated protein FliL